METVVYADVYFILNFSIDFICLYVSGAIVGRPQRRNRLIIASSIGGVYACIALFIENRVVSIISSVFVCFLMYLIGFKPSNFGGALYGATLLFCVNALFGGLYTAFVSIASGGSVEDLGFEYYPFFISLLAALIFVRILKAHNGNEKMYAEITYKGKTARYLSIVDSGNSLREPISGCGVAVLDASAACRIFSSEEIEIIAGSFGESEAFARGFRLITINTAVCSKKCFCVKADKIIVDKKRNRTEMGVYLVLSSQPLNGDIECLLPNSLNFDL